jgi:hypothetical protein
MENKNNGKGVSEVKPETKSTVKLDTLPAVNSQSTKEMLNGTEYEVMPENNDNQPTLGSKVKS